MTQLAVDIEKLIAARGITVEVGAPEGDLSSVLKRLCPELVPDDIGGKRPLEPRLPLLHQAVDVPEVRQRVGQPQMHFRIPGAAPFECCPQVVDVISQPLVPGVLLAASELWRGFFRNRYEELTVALLKLPHLATCVQALASVLVQRVEHSEPDRSWSSVDRDYKRLIHQAP